MRARAQGGIGMDRDTYARRLAAAVGGVLVAALAACGTASAPGGTVTVTVPAAPGGSSPGGGQSTPSTTPVAGSATPTSSAHAGPAECMTRQLSASIGH